MVRIFFLPYLGNRSKSDPCSYELFCLESHILSFPKVLQIPPESPCVYIYICKTEIYCYASKFSLIFLDYRQITIEIMCLLPILCSFPGWIVRKISVLQTKKVQWLLSTYSPIATNLISHVHSAQQKSSSLKFLKSRFTSDVRHSYHRY